MRSLLGAVLVWALCVISCSETSGTEGMAGAGGQAGWGGDGGSAGDGGGGGGGGGHGGGGGDGGAAGTSGGGAADECAEGLHFSQCQSGDGLCIDGICRVGCRCTGSYGAPCVDFVAKDLVLGSCIANTCVEGRCENDSDCSDHKDCTVETCLSGGVCESLAVRDGTPCAGGVCESGECVLDTAILPCTEQGIRNAVAAGGGPYRFDCDGPKTVSTESAFFVCEGVVLDGQGKLTIEGNARTVFELVGDFLELRGVGVTGSGSGIGCAAVGPPLGAGCSLGKMVTLTNSRITDNVGTGIYSRGVVALADSTVARNGRGISIEYGALSVRQSTIAENRWGGVSVYETAAEVTNSTVSGNVALGSDGDALHIGPGSTLTLTNSTVVGEIAVQVHEFSEGVAIMSSSSVLDGACIQGAGTWTSGGYNIESPGDTCGFDTTKGDQVNVSAGELKLSELADNGGPTRTHALGEGSVAIDRIPVEQCVDAEGEPLTNDQRGERRPETGGTMCDVGAFELQPLVN